MATEEFCNTPNSPGWNIAAVDVPWRACSPPFWKLGASMCKAVIGSHTKQEEDRPERRGGDTSEIRRVQE